MSQKNTEQKQKTPLQAMRTRMISYKVYVEVDKKDEIQQHLSELGYFMHALFSPGTHREMGYYWHLCIMIEANEAKLPDILWRMKRDGEISGYDVK